MDRQQPQHTVIDLEPRVGVLPPGALERMHAEPTFQALLHAMPDATVIVDAAAQIVLLNQQAERLFGYTQSELVGQAIEVLLPQRLRTRHEQHRAGFIAAPHARPMGSGLDLVALRRDGSEFPVEVSLSPMRTADGLLIVSVIHDITERQRAEAALRASQARLAGVVELAEDAIISVDATQRITMFNQGAEKIFGYAALEMLGQPLDRLLPARFQHLHRGHVAGFAHAPETTRMMGERREVWGRRKSGEEFPADASISKLILDDAPIFTVILRDITERKRAADELERQVQHRTAHLNALLQFSNDLLLQQSADEVLRRALDHALALVPEAQHGAIYLADIPSERLALRASRGLNPLPPIAVPTATGLIGQTFTTRQSRIIHSTAELHEHLSDPTGEPLLQPTFMPTPPTGIAAFPLLAHDEPVGVLVLLRETGSGPLAVDARSTLAALVNLTASAIVGEQNRQTAQALSSQLAQLEEQRQTLSERLNSVEAGMLQAARLAAVGQLAASIAHEINNPLYAARNGLYLIEEDLPEELRSLPYLRMVSDQLTRIAGIIERMRDFYRPPRGDLALYDINQLLEETLALAGFNLRHGAIQMIFTPAPELPPVLCNGDQLRQVFLNLVLNAIEAMPEGGTLTVRTQAGPTVAVIEIQDTGIGIPDDIRTHLFEPFFTNKSNGTGLGLSISAHIVTQHGGHIDVESAPGLGSTFRVVLPYKA